MTTRKDDTAFGNAVIVEFPYEKIKKANNEKKEMVPGVIIEIPKDKDELARKVISRSKNGFTCKHPGFKSGRLHHLESLLEEKACCLHDANSSISEIKEQPALITFEMNGELKQHYPDLLIKTDIRKVFQEIKTDKAANDPEVKQRTELLKEVLPLYGYEYELVKESELIKEPRLSNSKYLLRYGRKCFSLQDIEMVRIFIKDHGVLTWAEVKSGIFGKYSVALICNLILRGYCHSDMNVEWYGNVNITFSKRFL